MSALLSPAKGASVIEPVSVTVYARTCLLADALTKAVLIQPDSAALRACRARAVIVTSPRAIPHAA